MIPPPATNRTAAATAMDGPDFIDPYGAHRNVGIPIQGREWNAETIAAQDLAGMNFHQCTFSGVTFSAVNLLQTGFSDCRFDDCLFEGCDVLATRWVSCQGTGFRIVGGALREASLSECRHDRVRVEQSGRQIVLAQCHLGEVQFHGAGGSQDIATFSGTEIDRLDAPGARFRDGSAAGVDLANWQIENAVFERFSFVQVQAEGVDLSTVTLDACNLYRSRFAGATFRRAERCVFAESDLTDADFRDAAAGGSLFAKVTAHRCRFDRASLPRALFPEADLTKASFVAASAPDSVWVDARLDDANLERLSAPQGTFRNASFAGAILVNADLRETDLHGVEDELTVADTRDSRGSVLWRAEREKELQRLRDGDEG